MAWIDHGKIKEGFWGDVTSSLIWCEEKYQWSHYIAEPVNTLTNLFFFAISMYGVKKTVDEDMPLRFAIAYLGCAGVSIGSFAFHASLKYEAQLLDELPMIYTMAIFIYCVLETTPGYGKPRYAILLPTALVALVTFVTAAYIYNGNPVFHQAAYGLMQLVSTTQVVRLLRSKTSPLSQKQRKEISRLFWLGTVLFGGAFGLWNVDNIYCSRLRTLRKSTGYPWAVLLEGHGWWHLGTGLGGYIFLVAAQRLMLSSKENDGSNFEFAWTWGFLPYVKRVKPFRKASLANSRKSSENGTARAVASKDNKAR